MGLIYDVGVENGDDSAYYLHKGFRVVGIEASPPAVARLRRRFAAEIADGRYTLLPVGIAARSGEAIFWVCDDMPQWSSFDRSIASRGGARHHQAIVETRTFNSILGEFGRAAYCKIDIEGNDNLCIAAFDPETRPDHVSVELIDGAEQLSLLRSRGYSGFKLISQRLFRQPGSALLATDLPLPALLRRGVAAAASTLLRYRLDPGWRFPPGSSGPFGEDTPGRWRSFDQALADCDRVDRARQPPFDWYDIHARL